MEEQKNTKSSSESGSDKFNVRVIKQDNGSKTYKEFAFGNMEMTGTVVNVIQLENRLLNNILEYGKFLDLLNEYYLYLDFGFSSFEELLQRKLFYPNICFLAHALYCYVRDTKKNFKEETALNCHPNQCSECGFPEMIPQEGCIYCPVCGYSKKTE